MYTPSPPRELSRNHPAGQPGSGCALLLRSSDSADLRHRLCLYRIERPLSRAPEALRAWDVPFLSLFFPPRPQPARARAPAQRRLRAATAAGTKSPRGSARAHRSSLPALDLAISGAPGHRLTRFARRVRVAFASYAPAPSAAARPGLQRASARAPRSPQRPRAHPAQGSSQACVVRLGRVAPSWVHACTFEYQTERRGTPRDATSAPFLSRVHAASRRWDPCARRPLHISFEAHTAIFFPPYAQEFLAFTLMTCVVQPLDGPAVRFGRATTVPAADAAGSGPRGSTGGNGRRQEAGWRAAGGGEGRALEFASER